MCTRINKNKREILVFLYLVRFDFLQRLHLSHIYLNTLLFELSCYQRFRITVDE